MSEKSLNNYIKNIEDENDRLQIIIDSQKGKAKELQAQNRELTDAIKCLLLSADCTWEERDEGHDWREVVEQARKVLEKCKGVK